MSTKKQASLLAIVFCFSVSSFASAQNLLLNPGFETAGGTMTEPQNWSSFSFTSTSIRDTTMPNSGTANLLMQGGNRTTGSTGTFQSVLNIMPGQNYMASVFSKVDALPIDSDDATGGAYMRIEWHSDPNGATSEVSRITTSIGTTVTTNYSQFSVAGAAPATAGHARIVVGHRHNNRSIFYDDANFSLVAVPEPGTFGLVLTGLAGILFRRRRA